jgi:hypothetical protein
MGPSSGLSDGRQMRVVMDYRLAEGHQFERLNELLAGDILIEKAKGTCL